MILVFLYSLLIFHSIHTVISFHDILLFYKRKRLQYVILKEIIHVHKSSLSYSRLWTCLWWSNVNKHHFTSRNTVVETNTIKFTGTLIVFFFSNIIFSHTLHSDSCIQDDNHVTCSFSLYSIYYSISSTFSHFSLFLYTDVFYTITAQ